MAVACRPVTAAGAAGCGHDGQGGGVGGAAGARVGQGLEAVAVDVAVPPRCRRHGSGPRRPGRRPVGSRRRSSRCRQRRWPVKVVPAGGALQVRVTRPCARVAARACGAAGGCGRTAVSPASCPGRGRQPEGSGRVPVEEQDAPPGVCRPRPVPPIRRRVRTDRHSRWPSRARRPRVRRGPSGDRAVCPPVATAAGSGLRPPRKGVPTPALLRALTR